MSGAGLLTDQRNGFCFGKRRRWRERSFLCPLESAQDPFIGYDSNQNQEALGGQLPERRNADQRQRILDHAQQQSAQQDARHCPYTTLMLTPPTTEAAPSGARTEPGVGLR